MKKELLPQIKTSGFLLMDVEMEEEIALYIVSADVSTSCT